MSTPSSSKRFTIAIVGAVLFFSGLNTIIGLSQVRTGGVSILELFVSLLINVGCVALLWQLLKMHAVTRRQEKLAHQEMKAEIDRRAYFLRELEASSSHKLIPIKYLGGSGLNLNPEAQLVLSSTADKVVLTNVETLEQVALNTSDLTVVEISGPGTQTTSVGVAGGGFGVEGFLKGVVTAAAINALTTRSSTNTFLRLLGRSAEGYFHTSAIDTAALRMQLSPVIVRVEACKANTLEIGVDRLSDEVAKLHKLQQDGVLTADEFSAAKQKLLAATISNAR